MPDFSLQVVPSVYLFTELYEELQFVSVEDNKPVDFYFFSQ